MGVPEWSQLIRSLFISSCVIVLLWSWMTHRDPHTPGSRDHRILPISQRRSQATHTFAPAGPAYHPERVHCSLHELLHVSEIKCYFQKVSCKPKGRVGQGQRSSACVKFKMRSQRCFWLCMGYNCHHCKKTEKNIVCHDH